MRQINFTIYYDVRREMCQTVSFDGIKLVDQFKHMFVIHLIFNTSQVLYQ